MSSWEEGEEYSWCHSEPDFHGWALFVMVLQDEATLGGSCGKIVCKVQVTEQANRISKQVCNERKTNIWWEFSRRGGGKRWRKQEPG